MTNPLIDRVRALGARGAALVAGLSEFQQRIWVVSIVHDAYTDTFIVMHRKGYSAEMLARVEAMARSQVVQLEFGGQRHRLMRVK